VIIFHCYSLKTLAAISSFQLLFYVLIISHLSAAKGRGQKGGSFIGSAFLLQKVIDFFSNNDYNKCV